MKMYENNILLYRIDISIKNGIAEYLVMADGRIMGRYDDYASALIHLAQS